jgi:hypothetical protein
MTASSLPILFSGNCASTASTPARIMETPALNAVEVLCFSNRFDPEKDWLNGLKWDGVPHT